jgi:putative ABC transport system permease protein
MLKVALRGLVAHKGRLLATLLAVALGVAFIGGVLVLTDTMNSSFDDLFSGVYKGTDAVVRSSETIDSGFGDETRGDVDAGLLDKVRSVDAVKQAEGEVQGFAQIIGRDGDALGASGGFGPPSFGGNWQEVKQLNSWTLREGEGPTKPDEIVLDAASAKTADYEVGDEVPVQTKKGLTKFTLSGIAGFGNTDSPGGASYVLFTTEVAQQQVGQPGKFSAIGVVARSGVSQTAVTRDLRAVVGPGIQVLTGEQITKESQSDLKDQLSFFTIALLAFGVVAVLVGAFVIYNSFSIVVAQRTREMALLRAIGASRRQVRRAVVLEALAVGLVGSVVGFVLGLGIASLLMKVIDIEGSLVIRARPLVIAIAVGMVVTLVAALVPARRASSVPPVAALRETAIDSSGRSRRRLPIGLGLLVLGIVGVVVGAARIELALVGLGILAVFVGLIISGPGLAGPVSTVVGWPLSRFRGLTGTLAEKNAGRNPKRSAVTAFALMIGVGLVSFFLIFNTSIRASIDKVLDDTFAASFLISAGSFGEVGMPHEVAEKVAALPEVAEAVPVRQSAAKVDGKATSITATSPEGFTLFGFDVVSGTDQLGPGQVVVLDDTAKEKGLKLGDPFSAEFLNTGTADLTVAGIYTGTDANNFGDYVLGIDEFARFVPDNTDSMVVVKLAAGVTTAEAKPVLERTVKPFGTAKVQTVDDYKKTISGLFDVILTMILGLLGLAIVIALLGIANTIALSVLERTRELGLLRAVGMSRRQLRATIRWESVIIALFGAALGLLLGVLGAWGMVEALRDDGFEVFRLPLTSLVAVAVVAGVLGMVAAVVPAWRAGRLKVLDAIRTD